MQEGTEIPQIKDIKRKRQKIYEKAVEKWGYDAQTTMLIEECSELIEAICHHKRGRNGLFEIAEEMADVEVMIDQIKQVVGLEKTVENYKKDKIKRLKERVKE